MDKPIEVDSILNYGDTGKSPLNEQQTIRSHHSQSVHSVHSMHSQFQTGFNNQTSPRSYHDLHEIDESMAHLDGGTNQTPLEQLVASLSTNSFGMPRTYNNASLAQGSGSTNSMYGRSYYKKKVNYEKKTNLEMSVDPVLDLEAEEKLGTLLKKYILKKCSLNEHCRKQDFDGTALDGLNRLFFIQSLQAVEHYAASVSERIQKKPAYLMGILRGQESHWDNSRAAAQLEGGSVQLLNLPGRVQQQIGQYCLEGNCLPSDLTPEVLLSLHSLTTKYALKALNAFNSNKRIVAGCRGGVVNRPRFFQRLIENVIQQNPLTMDSHSTLGGSSSLLGDLADKTETDDVNKQDDPDTSAHAKDLSIDENLLVDDLEMETLALQQHTAPPPHIANMSSVSPKSNHSLFSSMLGGSKDSPQSPMRTKERDITGSPPGFGKSGENADILEERVKHLQFELRQRMLGEAAARNELQHVKKQLAHLETEYEKMRTSLEQLYGGIQQQLLSQVNSNKK